MRLKDLEVFITLIKEKSFSKTGEIMDVSQSSVTQVLQKLENAFNAKLVDRSSKSFTLTEAGSIFHDAAVEILEIFNTCKREIKQLTPDEFHAIKIAVSTTPGEFILPPFFSAFSSNISPDVNLIIEMSDSKEALDKLRTGDCQVAIVGSIMGEMDDNLEIFELLDEKLTIVVSNNVETVGNKITLKTLANLTRIDRKEGSGTRKETQSGLDEIDGKIKEIKQDHETRTIQLQSVQAVLSAISDSQDLWSIVGQFAAERYVQLKLIKEVDIEGVTIDPSRKIYLIHDKRQLNESLKNFLKELKKYYK
ncbi:MAG: LysR substrate-binding domain-containing protein [Candidatus Hodarchaeota archaeon]